MEKLSKSVWEDIAPTKIYFDQIEEIVKILKENSLDGTIEIKTKEHLISEVGELKEIKEPISYLQISSNKPSITVYLQPNGCQIYLRNNDEKSLGIMVKIKEVILKNKRQLLSILFAKKTIPYSFAQGAVISLLFFFLPSFIVQKYFDFIRNNHLLAFLIGALYIVVVIFGIIYSYILPTQATLIFSKRKNEMPGYFKREGDRIRTGLIINMMIAIISFLLGHFLK